MDALIVDMEKLKTLVSDGNDPWARGIRRDVAAPGDERGTHHQPSPVARSQTSQRPFPLRMPGLLLGINYKDRSLFDDKVMMNSAYSYDGVKGGMAWKSLVERYFITKAPCLRELLEWAEGEDNEPISEAKMIEAASLRLSEEQAMSVNSQIWGFLSGCLHGTAETMFKRAEWLNGIDAWRRIVRQIDHGRSIRLEMLRREVMELHTRPMKSLEAVEEGVATFENTHQEYARAGGPEAPDAELKSDLLRILPKEIRELLLWHSTNVGVTFQQFRDTVIAQTAQVLMMRGGSRFVNQVDAQADKHSDDYLAAVSQLAVCRNDEDRERLLTNLLAAVGDRRRPPGARAGRPGARAPPQRVGPRMCPNCGGTHAETRCPHPEVARDQRKCWNCKATGHSSRDCPKKPAAGKKINCMETEEPAMCMAIDFEGYTPVRGGAKRRPISKLPTLGDYFNENMFSNLSKETSKQVPRTRTTCGELGEAAPNLAQLAGRPPTTLPLKAGQDKRLRDAKMLESMNQQEFNDFIKMELATVEAVLAAEERVMCVTHEIDDDDGELNEVIVNETVIKVAIDSGSVASVINPNSLPNNLDFKPNVTGRHFKGANESHIENYGSCLTSLRDDKCKSNVSCDWSLAEVARPLHAVVKITGTPEHPKQDVLFTAGRCVVVPHGCVEKIMESTKPILQYDREGDLYVATLTVSAGFPRPGVKA